MSYSPSMRMREQGKQYQRGDDGTMSVGRLVRRMKNILEIEIGEVWVEGEVSNLRKQASGHYYFSLKDEQAQLGCAAFSAKRRCQGYEALQDGAKVRVFGEVTVYEARGQSQLIVKKVVPAGLGDLQVRFEALKSKLNEEGLFDARLKKPLPAFPQVIGLVTSGSGAALQDMMNVLSRRAPWVKAVLFPVAVQGEGAERGIVRAIRKLGEPEKHGLPRCDVIITGRGGGSMEDLWNFNEEDLARAIVACPIPIVSAVGHEIDFTISDFVADLRAPTPSAAAELVVPDAGELRTTLHRMRDGLRRPVREKLRAARDLIRLARRGALAHDADRVLREPALRLDEAGAAMKRAVDDWLQRISSCLSERRSSWKGRHPRLVVAQRVERLAQFRARYDQLAKHRLEGMEQRLERARRLLRTLGPESAFERGFSITLTAEGDLVTTPEQVTTGDRLATRVAGGRIESEVSEQ
ncbi:MAG: exodeoxyribonuclease VII large subunit [Verrucomicrobiaceae bacterium]|nr:exodeoxyribonuclease VII large subunit [Verrucomicrobiaceae bacterium]